MFLLLKKTHKLRHANDGLSGRTRPLQHAMHPGVQANKRRGKINNSFTMTQTDGEDADSTHYFWDVSCLNHNLHFNFRSFVQIQTKRFKRWDKTFSNSQNLHRPEPTKYLYRICGTLQKTMITNNWDCCAKAETRFIPSQPLLPYHILTFCSVTQSASSDISLVPHSSGLCRLTTADTRSHK